MRKPKVACFRYKRHNDVYVSKMELVNIVFEEEYDDVDIIAVPDKLYANIEELGQQFQRWLAKGEHNYWKILPNGQRVLIGETVGFVEWLNDHVLNNSDEEVKIIEEHVQYNPELGRVDF